MGKTDPAPLTRRQLDTMGCGSPGCHHDHTVVYLHGRCHPSRPTDLYWSESTGVITLRCTCGQFVASVVLANGARVDLDTRCHPHASVRASYHKDSGTVTVQCRQCRTAVGHPLAVAPAT